VLDYCGGSGGKALAFAPFMQNSGQIYVHDIRKSALLQAKQRLKRAGVQNYQIQEDKPMLRKTLKGKCDWVMLDVPCTGTGVLRKNPDQKWKFTPERLEELVAIQEIILKDSMHFLKKRTKGG
jgi:16S rRNA (cytosine967-C5)-methyltransferase